MCLVSLFTCSVYTTSINSCVVHGKTKTHTILTCSISLSRAISPALTGTIYAASLSERTMSIGFPVDYNFMFLVFGGILLTMVLLTACLPSSVNYKKLDTN